MLIHTKGNLIDLAEQGEFDVIVHGCNCQGVMGSGIAKEIKERYPAAFNLYKNDLEFKMPYDMIGNYSAFHVIHSRPNHNLARFDIINAYTQIGFQPRDKDHFEYTAFELILQKILMRFGAARYGFPYIGMGLAGGDKRKILNLLERFAEKVEDAGGTVTLVEFTN